MDEYEKELLIWAIVIVLLVVFIIVQMLYARRKGFRGLCPNCGQRQTGWVTQCVRCGVVFKEWKD